MSGKTDVAREMKKLRLIFGGHCIVCGGKKQLEFAHLEPTDVVGKGRGSKHRMLDIKRHMDKYELLCKNCHKLKDNGTPLLRFEKSVAKEQERAEYNLTARPRRDIVEDPTE